MCSEWHKDLPQDKEQWPTVVLAVLIERPSPFLAEMLERVTQLAYPKSRISLWVHNAVSQCLRGNVMATVCELRSSCTSTTL